LPPDRSRASRSRRRAAIAGALQIERADGRGNAYYWIAYVRLRRRHRRPAPTSRALADNRIAVTPLRLDMTDEPFMTKLAELFHK
jgi:5'-nucleotidase